MEWYKRKSRIALNGMRGLSLEERGFYDAALDLIYEDEGPITPAALKHETGVRDKRSFGRLLNGLVAKGRLILTADGRITDELAMFEIAMVQSATDRMSRGGTKGGRKKARREWQAGQGEMFGNLSANSSEKPSILNGQPSATLDHAGAHTREAGAEITAKLFGQSSGEVGELLPDCSQISPELGNVFNEDVASTLAHIDSDIREESPPIGSPQDSTDDRSRKKSKRAMPIPPDWQPPPATDRIAQITGEWPDGEVAKEAEKFANNALANGRTCKDWDAAWRNWIIIAEDLRQQRGSKHERPSGWLHARL